MKVCVVGAGAVGGLFAGWLGTSVPGLQMSALARGATLEALRDRGLMVTSADGSRRSVALAASDSPQALGEQDLVVVAVKGPALAAVAPSVAAMCGPATTVLVAMNGVPWWFFQGLGGRLDGAALRSIDSDGRIARHIATERVVGCVVHLSCATPEPGHVRHVQGNELILGEPDGRIGERLEAVAAPLRTAGFNVRLSDRIQRDIWFKLWGNMTMNPISALTGATADRILDDPLVRAFMSAVMIEARDIGAAIGIPIAQEPEQRHDVARKLGAFKTSMLQDVEAGRPLEIDALVTAVREIGQHLGLARLMARQRGLYPAA